MDSHLILKQSGDRNKINDYEFDSVMGIKFQCFSISKKIFLNSTT